MAGLRHWPRWATPLTWLIGLLPLGSVLWRLGEAVNPVELLTRSTGTWALTGLLLTLTITPLRQLGGGPALLRLRRPLGLLAFVYGVIHLLIYLLLDQQLAWAEIGRDLLKRPFITAGMAGFVLLLPLAITSTDGWMRRLKRRWGQLHRLVYPAAMLAVLHYFWLVKKDLTQPLIYATVLALLLGWRLWRRWHPAFRWHTAGRRG